MKKPFLLFCIATLALTSCTNPLHRPNTETIPPVETPISETENASKTASGEGAPIYTPRDNQMPQTGNIAPSSSLKDKLCLSTLCIRQDKPYFEFEDSYVQFYINSKFVEDKQIMLDPGEYIYAKGAQVTTYSDNSKYIGSSDPEVADTITIKIKKDGSRAEYSETWMGGEFKTIIQMPDNILLIQKGTGSCGGANIEQYFVNEKNVRVPLEKVVSEYPQKFQTAGISFTAYVPTGNVLYQGVANLPDAPEKIKEVWSIHDNLGEKLMNYIMKSQRFNNSYALEFSEYPGVVFFYKSGVKNSIAVIKLDTKGKKVDKNGFVQDIGLTKEIFSYYTFVDTEHFFISQSIQKKGAKDYKTYTVDDVEKIIPVFQIRAFVNDYYLLYTTPEYVSLPLAELCKPVVYVYDSVGKNRSLKVDMIPGAAFTKIIPEFNTDSRWDFRANNESQITSPGNTEVFPYLYYSANIPGYEFNTHGWQVWGYDVTKFFEEKLSKINFTSKEKSDFIDYWKNEFEENTLYFVSFKFNEDIEKYIKLSFSEQPESSLRILMEAYPLDPSLRKQNYAWPEVGTKLDTALLRTFERSGKFDVLEWGGTVYKSPGNVTVY